jgi:hypothetical protein
LNHAKNAARAVKGTAIQDLALSPKSYTELATILEEYGTPLVGGILFMKKVVIRPNKVVDDDEAFVR